jgi:hypothetical protein
VLRPTKPFHMKRRVTNNASVTSSQDGEYMIGIYATGPSLDDFSICDVVLQILAVFFRERTKKLIEPLQIIFPHRS